MPAAASGLFALAAAAAGEPDGGLALALAGAAASIVLARVEMQRQRYERDDLRLQLENALSHDGFRDIECGIGTLSALRVEWARQLARYQRRGERFSAVVFDVYAFGSEAEPGPEVMRAAVEQLQSLVRTEDSIFRVLPCRLAVVLSGSDQAGARAFIQRTIPLLGILEVEGEDRPVAVTVNGDVIDWREGVNEFPEHRFLWDETEDEANTRIFRRWSGQRSARPSRNAA
jgi:GGDEF domain-containing protein